MSLERRGDGNSLLSRRVDPYCYFEPTLETGGSVWINSTIVTSQPNPAAIRRNNFVVPVWIKVKWRPLNHECSHSSQQNQKRKTKFFFEKQNSRNALIQIPFSRKQFSATYFYRLYRSTVWKTFRLGLPVLVAARIECLTRIQVSSAVAVSCARATNKRD